MEFGGSFARNFSRCARNIVAGGLRRGKSTDRPGVGTRRARRPMRPTWTPTLELRTLTVSK
jgi:hypothetical protein